MRLIDADALIPMIKYATTDSEIGVYPIKIGFDAIKKVIDEMPTIEAEPVKHGKWIYKVFQNGIGYFMCSECCYASWSDEYNYCFDCGAKMDLDEVNNEKTL